MRKNKIIKIITIIGLIGISISSLSTIKASAAWKENNTGWWYTEGRSWATGWRNINNKWYYFGSDGYMEIGWILDGSRWYYLNESGAMLSNTITTDGYTLNSDGSWNKSIPKKTNSTITNSTSKIDTNNIKIDETSVYNNIIKMKSKYPTGMSWTNDNSYTSNVLGTGNGCAGFAFLLSDSAFGNLPVQKHTNFDNIRVGDILRINNDTHSVVVLEVKHDSVIVAEGNINSAIYWGREISLTDIKATGTYVLTRYSSASNTSATTDSGLNNKTEDNNKSNINNSTSHNDALNNNITQQIQTNTEQVSVNNEKQIDYDKFNDIVCDEMHRLVNEHRKNNGVAKFEIKSDLDRSAYLKSKDMIDNNYFDHNHNGVSFDKIAYKLSGVNINGENIAGNYIADNKYTEESAENLANALFTQWKNSSGHNANMLNKDYKAFGFGFMLGGKDANYTKVYATQQFVLKDFNDYNYQKNIVQDTDSNTNTNSTIYVNELELDTNNGKDVLNVGETKIIRARILPTNANNRSVKWKSSDESVVSVNNGKITANHVGIAYITCTTEDGSNLSATDEIHVVDCTHVSITNNISVTSISIHPNQIVTPLGYKCENNFKATVLPDNATDKSLTWKSSDESVATVDNNGNITPISKGKAIITCTANDGSKESDSGKVTVY